MNRVGIAEQIVQVSQNFLIGSCEKNTKGVAFSRLQRVHSQCVFGSTMGTDKGVDPPIRVTGNICKRCVTIGLFMQTVKGHNWKHLINGPGVGHRLKYRKIAEIFIGQFGFKIADIIRQKFQPGTEFFNFTANAPVNTFGHSPVSQRNQAK